MTKETEKQPIEQGTQDTEKSSATPKKDPKTTPETQDTETLGYLHVDLDGSATPDDLEDARKLHQARRLGGHPERLNGSTGLEGKLPKKE